MSVKKMTWAAAFALTVFVTACLASGTAKAADLPKISWRAQTVEVGGTNHYRCNENFVKLVAERTNGNFTIELFPVDTLYSAASTLDAVVEGVTEAAFSSSDYQSGKEPMLKLAAYRPTDNWRNFDMDEKLFQLTEPLIEEAYNKMGVVYAGSIFNFSVESFHSIPPIRTLSDFKGLKIRSSGLSQELYTALGASVVTMPMSEIYTALKLNTINAFEAGGYIDNYNSALQEVVKYSIEPALHNTGGVVVGQIIVNPEAYEALPEEYRQILRECAEENRKFTFDSCDTQNAEAKVKFEEAGVETITLSDADVLAAKEVAATNLKAYWGASEMTDRYLTVYVKFLEDNGMADVAAKVKK